jgi:hypothetical protein
VDFTPGLQWAPERLGKDARQPLLGMERPSSKTHKWGELHVQHSKLQEGSKKGQRKGIQHQQ